MKRFYITFFGLSATLLANAWGQKGHDTIAYIAEQHLSESAKEAIDSLLDGKSMVYWSNWLDNASHTPEYGYSKTWHYKNVDAGFSYEEAPLNNKGDIEKAVFEQIDILKSKNSTPEESTLALKILIHLVGDMHQPMHLGHLSDLGGNRINVKFFDKDSNLHAVWDTDMIESAHAWSYSEWQQQLDRLSAEEEQAIVQGTPIDWNKESVDYAAKIYEETPEGTEISYGYVFNWTPFIEQQLLNGGLRLASLLNSIFTPESTNQD